MLDRREFINTTLTAGAAGALHGTQLFASTIADPSITKGATKSRIVCANHDDLLSKQGISVQNLTQLLDSSISKLYNMPADDVWSHLFSKDDIVGLKVNCLAGRGLSTNIELVEAISTKLKKNGIPANHIIIWDRHDRDLERAGYKLYQGRRKVQCYGSNKTGFSRKLYEHGAVASLISVILEQQCSAIINLPILKDHGIVGISAAMKNNFGVINNPNKYHDNVGDPYVADVNMLPIIRNKTRLIICDAITPQYEGGPPFMPQWTWNMNSLVLGTDPVALDTFAWNVIEKKRREKGFPPLKEVGREPVYIQTAADRDHKLGTNNMNNIELIQL